MAFHEKAGPGQVDFDLPFLKFPFPSWREGVQSGPERSRARSLRRSEPFHEKAGPGQVDFDLPFLKFPFPSWREGCAERPGAVKGAFFAA